MALTFSTHEYCNGIPRMDYSTSGKTTDVTKVYDEKLGFSRLYTVDGDLLVLVTNNYGAPWSASWVSHSFSANLLMDARIVQFFYDTYIAPLVGNPRSCKCGLVCSCKVDEAPMNAFLEQFGFNDVYVGGLSNLQISLVPVGKKFRVTEYDGCESLMIVDEKWFTS